jgi:hypothetical protein
VISAFSLPVALAMKFCSAAEQPGLAHRQRSVADHRDLAVLDLSFECPDRHHLHRADGDRLIVATSLLTDYTGSGPS